MYATDFTPEAADDLRAFRKFDQQQVFDAIGMQLAHEPGRETRNRKRLRPNNLAEWELRVGDLRVFYDVDPQRLEVLIIAIGRKQGGKLYVHGEEFDL